MKKLILVLILVLVPGLSFAGAHSVSIVRGPVVAGDYNDIVFFWTAESTTLGADDYSAGDTTAALQSSASISPTAAIVGSNGVLIPTASDFARFVVSSNDIYPASGRIGLYVYANTIPVDGVGFLRWANADATSRAVVQFTSSGDIDVYWRDSGTSRTACASTTDPIAADTAYFIEIAYDTNYREIFVDGASVANCTTTTTQQNPTVLDIGNESAVSPGDGLHIDQIMVSNDKTRNLYLLRNLTESPR